MGTKGKGTALVRGAGETTRSASSPGHDSSRNDRALRDKIVDPRNLIGIEKYRSGLDMSAGVQFGVRTVLAASYRRRPAPQEQGMDQKVTSKEE